MASILNEKIKNINPYHAIKLCLVHDLAECITGDVDSFRITNKEITKEQKDEEEEKAITTLKKDFPDIGKEIYNLWQEYQESKTIEAKYVKALDKLESLTHILSVNYILVKDKLRAKHTATYADKAVEDFPQLKPILENIKKRLKEEYIKQGLK
ncbi:MAG: HD domain-containing protein [Candidatus Pacebacteria bacterium]|nr:HD domain-containing protein [Candidatus Paceibacterota bacterium]